MVQKPKFSIVFSISLLLWSQFSSGLIIKDAVDEAINTNPQIWGRKYSCFASALQVRQASARYYPRVDLFADTGPEHAFNNATRSTFGGASNFIRREGNMDVRQIILDGGRTESTVRQREAQRRFACSQLEEANQVIGFRATETFINVIRNRIIVAIFREDVAAHERMLERIEKRTQGGLGKISEVQLAQSRLALARSRLYEAENNLSDANLNFQEVVGFLPSDDLKLPVMPQVLPETVDAAQKIAELNSPVLESSRALVSAQKAQIDVSRSAFMPELSFDVTTFHGDDLNGVPGRNVIVNGLLTMNWNLYNGGGDLAQYRTERALYNETLFELQDSQRFVINSVGTAYNFYIINQDRIVALNDHLRDSFNVFRSYEKEFEVGSRSLFDLLNSQTEYYRARVERTNGVLDQYINSYRLLAAMGVLTSYFYGENGICHELCTIYDDAPIYLGHNQSFEMGERSFDSNESEAMIEKNLQIDETTQHELIEAEKKADRVETLTVPALKEDPFNTSDDGNTEWNKQKSLEQNEEMMDEMTGETPPQPDPEEENSQQLIEPALHNDT